MTPPILSLRINMADPIVAMSDRERIEWLAALLATIKETGTITMMRQLINDPSWDDSASQSHLRKSK